MNTVLLAIIVLFFTNMAICGDNATNAPELYWQTNSPLGRYCCEITAGALGSNQQGQRVYVRSTSNRQKRELVYESPRTVAVNWSPDGQFLAVVDHASGHSSAVSVFGIRAGGDIDHWIVRPVYNSPWPTRAEIFWSFESWNLDDGTVCLQCEFLPEDRSSGHGGELARRRYVVPITVGVSRGLPPTETPPPTNPPADGKRGTSRGQPSSKQIRPE